MSPDRQKKLRDFTVSLEQSGQAVLPALIADELVKQLLLLNFEKSAPRRAADLNIHVRTFNRYVNGDTAPTLHTAARLLNSLGYDMVVRRRDGE